MQTTGYPRGPGVVRLGTVSGVLTAAAAFGALLTFARRDHHSPFPPTVGPAAGALLLLLVSLAWGYLFALVAAPLRGLRVVGVAFLTSAAVWVISAQLLPPALRLGNGLYASSPRSAAVHLLIALALASGMRLAR